MMHKAWCSIEEVPYGFSRSSIEFHGHTGGKIDDLNPIWVITKDQGKVYAKSQGQRSKVKVTEVTTQLNRFRTVTPLWIHIGWRNDAYSLIMLRRGALLFFKAIRQISRSHG